MRLILGTKSKARQEILNNAGFKFEPRTTNVEEKTNDKNIQENIKTQKDAENYVKNLSLLKGENIFKELSKEEKISENSEDKDKEIIIITADTVVFCEDRMIEKPMDQQNAMEILNFMSGKKTVAITGVTIIDLLNEKTITFSESSDVYLKEISDKEMIWYISMTTNLLDVAGYTIDTTASIFVDRIEGDYNNVLGLPISRIYDELKDLGYNILHFRK